jgi:hypothetical protein
MSRVFCGKFVDGLKRLFRAHKLDFHGSLRGVADSKQFRRFLRQLFRQDWVVYANRPFRGPEYVLQYLARYTHRVAISNHRLIAMEDSQVSFCYKDYAHGGKKRKMTVSADEFLRRFLLHVLPQGFVRIRHFGSWPTAAALDWLLSAINYWVIHHSRVRQLPLPRRHINGSAQIAVRQ